MHGALQSNRMMTVDMLKSLPAEAVGTFTQTRDGTAGATGSALRGIKLPALIEYIGLSSEAKANWKTLLVTATATDGYRAVFTWAELINTPTGEGVLVVFERDGAPLDAREGRIALQSSADFRLGARHVRNLLRIEVSLL
jgi:hypothetical protein